MRHRGVVRLLFGVDYVQLDGAQTFLHLAPISFDAATFEVWGALLHGAQLCFVSGKSAESPRAWRSFEETPSQHAMVDGGLV